MNRGRVRVPSSLIDALARHCEDVDFPCSPSRLCTLAQVLDDVPDPRRVRGRRYRIGSLFALCTIAVLGGAKSVTAIARFAADSGPELRRCLRFTSATPNTTTLGRLLARLGRQRPGRRHRHLAGPFRHRPRGRTR
ncbi:transposase family protein [Streptomyces sp. NPDC056982]|uniref:transposase family protein n=1 Tax=Streptomyces sp. NPDC056982 TaxID=3345986 RepID=UPI00362AD4CE